MWCHIHNSSQSLDNIITWTTFSTQPPQPFSPASLSSSKTLFVTFATFSNWFSSQTHHQAVQSSEPKYFIKTAPLYFLFSSFTFEIYYYLLFQIWCDGEIVVMAITDSYKAGVQESSKEPVSCDPIYAPVRQTRWVISDLPWVNHDQQKWLGHDENPRASFLPAVDPAWLGLVESGKYLTWRSEKTQVCINYTKTGMRRGNQWFEKVLEIFICGQFPL